MKIRIISTIVLYAFISICLSQNQQQGGICYRSDKVVTYVSNEVVMTKIGLPTQLYCCVINSQFVGWIFMDNKINSGGKYTLTFDKLTNAQTLTINNVQESDSGTYFCRVSSKNNDVRDFPVLMNIKAQLNNPNSKYYLEVSKTERIPLHIAGIPFPTVHFYRSSNTQTALVETYSSHQQIKNGRFEILPNGDVVIHNLQQSDTGIYVLKLSQGGSLPSDEYTIEIYAGARPFVAYIPKPFYNFTLGENEIIPARFSGDSLNIYWKFTSDMLGERAERITGDTDAHYFVSVDGSLTVINVVNNDVGKYVGVCSNPWGEVQVSATVRTTIRPAQIISLNNVVSDVNGNASFSVTASGSPPPYISWWRNGVQLKSQRIRDTISELRLQFIQRNDAGIYTCIADNGATSDGNRVYASKNVTLYVTGFPVMELQKSSLIVVTTQNRKIVQLKCVASGFSLAEIVFKKDNTTYTPSSVVISQQYSDTREATLKLTIDSPSKLGNYTCAATNPYGTSMLTITVKHMDIPIYPRNIRILQLNPTSVIIGWDAIEKGFSSFFYSYLANVWNTGRAVMFSQNTSDTFVTFNGLYKATSYYFSVRSSNEAGWSAPSKTLGFLTPNIGRPSPPQILNREIFLPTVNFRLYWAGPMNDGGDAVITYNVRQCIWDLEKINMDRDCKDFNTIRSNEIFFNGLVSFQLYDFYVTAENQIETSLPARYQVFTGANAILGLPGTTTPQMIAIFIILSTFLLILLIDLLMCVFFRMGILYWLIHACWFFPLCVAGDKVPLRKDTMMGVKSKSANESTKSMYQTVFQEDVERVDTSKYMIVDDQMYQEIVVEQSKSSKILQTEDVVEIPFASNLKMSNEKVLSKSKTNSNIDKNIFEARDIVKTNKNYESSSKNESEQSNQYISKPKYGIPVIYNKSSDDTLVLKKSEQVENISNSVDVLDVQQQKDQKNLKKTQNASKLLSSNAYESLYENYEVASSEDRQINKFNATSEEESEEAYIEIPVKSKQPNVDSEVKKETTAEFEGKFEGQDMVI